MNVRGFGLNQDESQAIAQNMPGVYDLLPSRRYVAVNGGYVEDLRSGIARMLDYDDAGALLSNAGLVAQADALHAPLDTNQFSINPSSVYDILGCGKDTLGTIRMYDGGTYDIDPTKGDGTVPLTSAFNLAEGYQTFFDLGDDHVGLVQKSAPLTLIRDILDGVTTAAIGGISPSLGDCFIPDELSISLHGPAELQIYDAAGRHVGPNDADGTVDLGIPSSSYDVIGDNVFVTLPASGGPYHVSAVATASGTVTLASKTVSGGAVKKKTTYAAVKLPKTRATASLDLTATNTSPVLAVDTDADGISDASVPPTAVLDTPSSLEDITPPILSMPAIPANPMLLSTTTLMFSATDAGSGIGSIVATLDGAPLTNGETVTFTKPGANAFVLTAIDNAGNPASREIDFTVLSPSGASPPNHCGP
jgi:hypothetical protein